MWGSTCVIANGAVPFIYIKINKTAFNNVLSSFAIQANWRPAAAKGQAQPGGPDAAERSGPPRQPAGTRELELAAEPVMASAPEAVTPRRPLAGATAGAGASSEPSPVLRAGASQTPLIAGAQAVSA